MIVLGTRTCDKTGVIERYIAHHPEVKHVIVFSPKSTSQYMPEAGDFSFEHYAWEDIIMYKVFYPLLEKIDNSYLVVMNEIMRTRKRSDLTYNCLKHYVNQTSHIILFQYFPIIEDTSDFMILLDLEHPGRFRNMKFSLDLLDDVKIVGIDMRPDLEIITIPSTQEESRYKAEVAHLFDSLGSKDPDTIPRNLELWVGKIKKKHIGNETYIARNKRYGLENVISIKDAIQTGTRGIIVDMPHDMKTLTDYMFFANVKKLSFLSTGLSIDRYYEERSAIWHRKAGEIYAKAGICK